MDASGLVRSLRLVKSERELDYLRKAGGIVDKMRDAALNETRPGAFEGEIMGKVWYTSFANDGDPPAHRPPIGNGAAALNMRYTTGRKLVDHDDQVTFELGLDTALPRSEHVRGVDGAERRPSASEDARRMR